MKFGKQLRREATLPWNEKYSDHYVDYKMLKQHIRSMIANESEAITNTPVHFRTLLLSELSKIDNCTRVRAKELGKRMDKANSLLQTGDQEKYSKILNVCKRHLLLLSTFVDINSAALRKIAKKFDKKVLGAKGAESMMHNGEITTMTAFIEVFLAKVLERFATKQGKFESDISEGLFKTASPHEEINEELLEELEIHEDIPVYNDLPLDALPSGEITTMFVSLIQNELSRTIDVPVLVAKGKIEGPVLGVTSTLHGNEVNGIPVISKLFREIDVESLRGTLVGVPVLNPPGFSRRQRAFLDGRDLNRIFPGKPAGTSSQTYCHMILEKFAKKFDYHLDLHTAGLGRVNSLYVRADMNNPITHQMAVLQQSQIILHNTAPDGSLRIASMALGIPSITVEIGNPLQIHQEFVECALSGVRATLDWLNMLPIYPSEKIEETSSRAKTTTCTRSYWVYAEHGGMLQVMPKINTWVSKGDVVAVVRDVFGNILVKYKAKEDSIVIGKSVNPICCAGERVVHLGVCDDEFGKKK